jgi:hypothetical protein
MDRKEGEPGASLRLKAELHALQRTYETLFEGLGKSGGRVTKTMAG